MDLECSTLPKRTEIDGQSGLGAEDRMSGHAQPAARRLPRRDESSVYLEVRFDLVDTAVCPKPPSLDLHCSK